MKKPFYLLPVIFFLLLSCDKEDPVVLGFGEITDISMPESSSSKIAQEIKITVRLSGCNFIRKTVKTVRGNIFEYNIIIERHSGADVVCIAGSFEKVVTVNFDPAGPGAYTLNFFINGTLSETRTVSVTG